MKRKLRIDRIIVAIIVLILIVGAVIYLLKPKDNTLMIDLTNKTVAEAEAFAKENNLNLVIEEQVNSFEKDKIFDQSIEVDQEINKNDTLTIYVSLGINYEELKVNELGDVPIMMYHGIHNITDNEYTGGNVDKDGYQRTAEAFRKALGYTLDNVDALIEQINQKLPEYDAVEKGDRGWGMTYEVVMDITGPNGKTAKVLTAWIDDK